MSQCDEPVYCECGKPMKRLFGTANFFIKGSSEANGYDMSTPFKKKPIIDVEL